MTRNRPWSSLSRVSLKPILHDELHRATARLARHQPKRPAGRIAVGSPQRGKVQRCEGLPPEVERLMVHQAEPAQERKIPFPEAGLAQAIAGLHTEGPGGG